MAMPKQIFSDAEGFLEYFEKRKEANGTVQKDGDDDGDDDYELV